MEQLLFSAILALLLIHEMDAIRAKEWRMFAVLKDMVEETAYKVFVIIHFPLYLSALYALSNEGTASFSLQIIIDVFLLGHAILHYVFRKHKYNSFQTLFSKLIINIMPVLSILHLLLLYFL